jgi:hypothetical protein
MEVRHMSNAQQDSKPGKFKRWLVIVIIAIGIGATLAAGYFVWQYGPDETWQMLLWSAGIALVGFAGTAIVLSFLCESGDFFRYWRHVISRASADWWHFAKDHWKKLLGGNVAFLPVVALFALLASRDKAWEKGLWARIAAVVELAMCFGWFVYYLLRAPWLLELEMKEILDQRDKRIAELVLDQRDKRIAELEAKEAARSSEEEKARQREAEAEARAKRKEEEQEAKETRKEEAAEAKRKQRQELHAAFFKLLEELKEIIRRAETSKPFTGAGSGDYDRAREQHATPTKTALADWLGRATREAANADQNGYLSSEDELMAASAALDKLVAFANKQETAMNTILAKLG